MARQKKVTADKSLDDLFAKNRRDDKSRKAIYQAYAIRQIRGPEEHDDIVISATDPVDAHRQFFNYYALVNTAYRYTLRVAKIPEDDPRAKKAIQCQHPRTPGGTQTVDELIQQHDEEVSRQLGETEMQMA